MGLPGASPCQDDENFYKDSEIDHENRNIEFWLSQYCYHHPDKKEFYKTKY